MNYNKNLRQKLYDNPLYIRRRRQWRVVVMALAAFIFNTTEFVPIALLTDIGKSFAMSVASVGTMITVYAWLVAVLSLPAMLLTASMPRKKLLLGLFGLFITGHVISVLANNFAVLLVGRAIIALAHAVFWSITASLVVRVAPRDWQTKALGLLSMGSALATVLGLPLGRIIGQVLGWRMTFGIIGFAAALTMGMLGWLLPTLPSKNVGSLASLPKIGKNTKLVGIYGLTVLCVTAHFTAYSYVEPLVLQINQFSKSFATFILLIFGLAGCVASWGFGRYYETYPKPFLLMAMMGLCLVLASLMIITGSHVLWLGAAFIWGGCITAISLALQFNVLKLAPDATDVAMSIFSGIYNVGIGGGALVGGLVITSLGLAMVSQVGALIALLAMLIWLGLFGRKKPIS